MATSVFLDLHNKFRSLPNLLCLIFCSKTPPLTPISSSPLRREDKGEVENAPCAWGLPFLFTTRNANSFEK